LREKLKEKEIENDELKVQLNNADKKIQLLEKQLEEAIHSKVELIKTSYQSMIYYRNIIQQLADKKINVQMPSNGFYHIK